MKLISSIKIIFFLFILANPSYSQFWINISEYSGQLMLIDKNDIIYLVNPVYSGNSFIYVSEDGGNSFHETGSIAAYITSIEESFLSDAVYVGTLNQGVFRTTDKGLSWQNIGIKDEYINCILSTSEGALLVGSDDHIFHSADEGMSWKTDSLRLPGIVNNLLTWSLFEDSGGFLFAGTNCGIWRSTDKGISWNLLDSFQCGDILSFTEKDNKIYMGGADRFQGIHRSDDRGLSWTEIFSRRGTTYSLLAAPDSNIYIACDGGIYRTNKIDTLWEEINTGLPSSQVLYNIGYSTNGYLYTVSGGLYRSKEKIFYNNEPEIPYSILLHQNYPNPFNPGTTIEYSIPELSIVTLKVFNVIGEEVTTLINEEKNTGNYTAEFSAGSLSSGVYFYQLQTTGQAGRYKAIKKMLLLR
jgi:hypothetical protein